MDNKTGEKFKKIIEFLVGVLLTLTVVFAYASSYHFLSNYSDHIEEYKVPTEAISIENDEVHISLANNITDGHYIISRTLSETPLLINGNRIKPLAFTKPELLTKNLITYKIKKEDSKKVQFFVSKKSTLESAIEKHKNIKALERIIILIPYFFGLIIIYAVMLTTYKNNQYFKIMLLGFSMGLVSLMDLLRIDGAVLSQSFKSAYYLSLLLMSYLIVKTYQLISKQNNKSQKIIYLVLFANLAWSLSTTSITNSWLFFFDSAVLISIIMLSVSIIKSTKKGKYFSVNLAILIGTFIIQALTKSERYNVNHFAQITLLIGILFNYLYENFLNEKRILEETRKQIMERLSKAVVHDLRKPISIISELIKNDPKFRQEIKAQLSPQINKAASLLESLMDISRESKINLFKTNIENTIKNTIQQLEPDIKKNETKIELDLEKNLSAMVDPQKFERVLYNIVQNALEAQTYPKKTENPFLKIIAKIKKNQILIRVSNNGPLIKDKDIESIFSSLYSRNKPNGTGIGLSSAKSVIERMNGQIYAKNIHYPDGVEFEIILPQSKEVYEELNLLDKKAITITIINDDELTRINLENKIKGFIESDFLETNIEIQTFDSFQDNEQKILIENSLILCDYDLNCDYTGIDIMNRVKATNPTNVIFKLVTNWEFEKTLDCDILRPDFPKENINQDIKKLLCAN